MLAILAYVVLVLLFMLWLLWPLIRPSKRPPDEHTTLMDDPGLCERCRTGSGFGELRP